ncbi:hypothetical protein ABTK92_20865, partial [Acinetobacter baumannii]
NVPLAPGLAVRAVGWYDHEGGYIDNTYKERTYQRTHTVGTDEGGNPVYADAPLTVNNGAFVKNNFNDVYTAGGRLTL